MGASASMGKASLADSDASGSSALYAAQEYAGRNKKGANNRFRAKAKSKGGGGTSSFTGSIGSYGSLARLNSRNILSPLIIEVLDVTGFAQEMSDVYVRVSLCRFVQARNTFVVLSQTNTTKRSNTSTPKWHSFRPLFPQYRPNDILQVEVLTEKRLLNVTRTVLATGQIELSILDKGKASKDWDGKVHVEVEATNALKQIQEGNLTVCIRRVNLPSGGGTRKRVFLIRHGESRWNAAQAKRDVLSMLGSKDHPLNRNGIEQAKEFQKRVQFTQAVYMNKQQDMEDPCNQTIRLSGALPSPHKSPRSSASSPTSPKRRRSLSNFVKRRSRDSIKSTEEKEEDEEGILNKTFQESFFEASEILVSPLSRALQTALIALQGHHHMNTKGMKLYSCVREVQNLLGKDSRGEVFGEQSIQRALQLLDNELGKEESLELMKNCAWIDPFDTESTWWINTKESRTSVMERMEELVNFIHFSNFSSVVVVGHSLFFRQLFQSLPYRIDPQKYTSEQINHKSSILEQLQQTKIENCGCVGIEMDFDIVHFPHMRKMESLTRLLSDDDCASIHSLHSTPNGSLAGFPTSGGGIPAEVQHGSLASLESLDDPSFFQSTIVDVEMMFGSGFSSNMEDSNTLTTNEFRPPTSTM